MKTFVPSNEREMDLIDYILTVVNILIMLTISTQGWLGLLVSVGLTFYITAWVKWRRP